MQRMSESLRGPLCLRRAAVWLVAALWCGVASADHVKQLQREAMTSGRASWGHWGSSAESYSGWTMHTNRLIPIYTYGMPLDAFTGSKSLYRHPWAVRQLFGRMPPGTLNPTADYCDQTDVYRLQQAAVAAGKKYIVLFVFDGMDWQTIWAAATHAAGRVAYREGRGKGLFFQDYARASTDFGFCVTAPLVDGPVGNPDTQQVAQGDDNRFGGYDPRKGGPNPWTEGNEAEYITGKSLAAHPYTDSSSSATSLTCGVKTYNDAINVGLRGEQLVPISHLLQRAGWAVGVVTSVPISHATPACAYAHNVVRDDFQDLTRDLLGLPSVSHPHEPLPGVDVLLGAGWGETFERDSKQGKNYVPGNAYVTPADLARIDCRHGGHYVVVQRTAGIEGRSAVEAAANDAAHRGLRLFGLFGTRGGARPGSAGGHLPFQTADGQYDPTVGALGIAEKYTPEDVRENPSLADLTSAALKVLEKNQKGFWLMVEAGDVDWANHQNNVDNSIGAVKSGDEAFRVVARWTEARQAWDETLVIVTADHGHYLVLKQPEALVAPADGTAKSQPK